MQNKSPRQDLKSKTTMEKEKKQEIKQTGKKGGIQSSRVSESDMNKTSTYDQPDDYAGS